jgi:hypothetical protein
MQNNQNKIIPLFLILVFSSLSSSYGQAFLRDIGVADSLFEENKFTESFDIYKAIYESGEHASPAMLLKMAYIREGLGDESGALFYLNSYYLQTTNERVFVKMEELANENNLKGYDYEQEDWFLNIYHKNYYSILLVISVLIFTVFCWLLYKRIVIKESAYFGAAIIALFSLLLLLMINFGRDYDQGILTKQHTYIMSAPSASADVLDVTTAGHKVKILGHEDIWIQVEWDNRTGYVKSKYVKPLYF